MITTKEILVTILKELKGILIKSTKEFFEPVFHLYKKLLRKYSEIRPR